MFASSSSSSTSSVLEVIASTGSTGPGAISSTICARGGGDAVKARRVARSLVCTGLAIFLGAFQCIAQLAFLSRLLSYIVTRAALAWLLMTQRVRQRPRAHGAARGRNRRRLPFVWDVVFVAPRPLLLHIDPPQVHLPVDHRKEQREAPTRDDEQRNRDTG